MASKHCAACTILIAAVANSWLSQLSAQGPGAVLQDPVVLSEIMYDPVGSEFYDEFVEVFNRSKEDTISLSGWFIGDESSLDEIVDAGEGLNLGPDGFALILDQGYFSNSTSYDSLIPDEALVVTIDGASFGQNGWTNSVSKTIVMIRPDGTIADRHAYPTGYSSGHSDEKIDLYDEEKPGNWAQSRTLLGTPGFANSTRILRKDLELANVVFAPNPIPAEQDGVFSMILRNQGREILNNIEISLFSDLNSDSVPQDIELLLVIPVSDVQIDSRDSLAISMTMPPLAPGIHDLSLLAQIEGDENQQNNLYEETVWKGYPRSAVILNEIMYRPLSGYPEWIELFNISSGPVMLRNWFLMEVGAARIHRLTGDPVLLDSGEYLVVAADSSVEIDMTPSLLVPESFPSLNNDGEEIQLLDFAHQPIDELHYRDDWGGESGVSIERINPRVKTQDSTNWASSAAPTGSTPGRQNSLYTELVPSDASLTISPNPFSPNDDGHEDFTILQLNLPVLTATISVKIYDVLGREVADILNNAPSGSERQIVWNGKAENGGSLRTGVYIVFIQALNQKMGVLEELKKPVVVVGGQ